MRPCPAGAALLNFSLCYVCAQCVHSVCTVTVCVRVSMTVGLCVFCVLSVLLINARLPVAQLCRNYSAARDVRLFERSNGVSVLSAGTDLRTVTRLSVKVTPCVWMPHTLFQFFFFPSAVLCLTFMYEE